MNDDNYIPEAMTEYPTMQQFEVEPFLVEGKWFFICPVTGETLECTMDSKDWLEIERA